MNELSGKTVVVTGASKGIGKEIAREMARKGANVVVNYFQSKNKAELLVKEIRENGGVAISIKGDVSVQSDITRLFDLSNQAFGSVDVLVNNAGVYNFEPLDVLSETSFNEQMKINVLGPIMSCQEVVKYFDKNGGAIINISSVAAVQPTVGAAIYTATKAALNGVTSVLAKELGEKNIRVNSIMPGLINTEGTQELGVIGSDAEKYMIANTPLGRTGEPLDVAKVAVFLASGNAAWITGQHIAVSGGF